ncbi:hypothetical protein Dimus_032633 [Dionaea muscipula]
MHPDNKPTPPSISDSSHRRILKPAPKRLKKTEPIAEEEKKSKLLLAGYLAQEFLTNGTLFGQVYGEDDKAASADAAVRILSDEPTIVAKEKPIEDEAKKAEERNEEVEEEEEKKMKKYKMYVDVANLLKGDGAHLPGVFNPSQLAEYLKI